jgi:DNA-binding NtrC family response regulator
MRRRELNLAYYPYMSRAEHTPASPEIPREAVLVVDDERPLLDVFVQALGTRFDVTAATSAREAEFILRKKTFKVVVADHLMPGGNGMSFLVRAREEYPHMQRILVTGYMKPEMLLRSVNEAALFRYLLKPVSVVELLNVVTEAAKLHDALSKVASEAPSSE